MINADPKYIQGTPEWLEFRKDFIGASDAPIIMELSPWSTPYQLWQEKLGLIQSKPMNWAMQRGNDLEAIALETYNNMTGNNAYPDIVFNPIHPWAMASLDGISLDRKLVVEIKCPGKTDHDLAADGKVPEKYYAQIQHQMAAADVQALDYFSYSEESQHLIRVERDDKFIAKMYKKEEKFFQCMKNMEPPALMDRDYEPRFDPQWEVKAERYKELAQASKLIEAELKELKADLVSMSDNRNCTGAGIKVQKIIRKGNVDYSRIPEIEGINLEPYRKEPITMWKIS